MLAAFASRGFKGVGLDVNNDLVRKINDKEAPFNEPNLAEFLKKHKKDISATSSYQQAIQQSEISFVIVPTPSDKNGGFSSQFVEQAAQEIGKVFNNKFNYHLVVIVSTLLPKIVETKILPILEKESGKKCGQDFGLCYSPLFIALGNVIDNILNPDFVLVGEYDKKSGNLLEDFYKKVVVNKAPIVRMNIINAELTKIAVNSYITMKITFANMLGEICENLPGADIDNITEAIGQDLRIGKKYLKAGLGFGGPCFPRDNIALSSFSKTIQVAPILFSATDSVNRTQTNRIVKRILSSGNIAKVALLGLAYKTGTSVTEQSQGMEIAQKFLKLNKEVKVYDPFIHDADYLKGLVVTKSVDECIKGVDCIIVALPYPEFNKISEKLGNNNPIIYDCWRILDQKLFRGEATYFATGLADSILLNLNTLKKQKIVVCGAGGFIGGHMVADLVNKGYQNITAVDIKPIDCWNQYFANIENLQLDLRDKRACEAALKKAFMIYNFAADMGGMAFIESNKARCMINVLINTHLLQAAVKNKVKRFFFASSACIYNTQKQHLPNLPPLKETDAYPAFPEDGYGWEKLFSERLCKNFFDDFGLETRVARYHNIYGPFGTHDGRRAKAPAAICRKVAEAKITGNHKVEIWGDGKQTRSFTFIDDCIKGTNKIMFSDIQEPVNLGSSEKVTINQLVDITEKIAGIKLKRNYNLGAPKGVYGRNSDNTLIKKHLGWEPSTKLVEGIEKTYKWIYEQIRT